MTRALDSARRLFARLPAPLALRVLLLRAARAILEPDARISYAREGTDQIAMELLGFAPTGYYVDVGANHPVRASNTFELYRIGWTGLLIDGSPRMVELCRRTRPLDTVVHAVVSDAEREAEFVEFETTDVSTLDAEHARIWGARYAVQARHQVRTQTLTHLCEAHGVPASFDLLSVDVERHDVAVLSSLDFSRFRPRLVVVEVLDEGTGDRSEAAALLASQGYARVAKGAMNAYFLDTRG